MLKVPGANGRGYKSASECKTCVSEKRLRVEGVTVSEGSTTFIVCEVPTFGDIRRYVAASQYVWHETRVLQVQFFKALILN